MDFTKDCSISSRSDGASSLLFNPINCWLPYRVLGSVGSPRGYCLEIVLSYTPVHDGVQRMWTLCHTQLSESGNDCTFWYYVCQLLVHELSCTVPGIPTQHATPEPLTWCAPPRQTLIVATEDWCGLATRKPQPASRLNLVWNTYLAADSVTVTQGVQPEDELWLAFGTGKNFWYQVTNELAAGLIPEKVRHCKCPMLWLGATSCPVSFW